MMKLNEEINRMKFLMNLSEDNQLSLFDQTDEDDSDVYYYSHITSVPGASTRTFKNLKDDKGNNKPFIPNPDSKIIMIGKDGLYTFEKGNKLYKPREDRNRENEAYFWIKDYPELKVGPTSIKSDNKNYFLDSDFIRESLKKAFPEYWSPEDDEFSAGLRGIYPISPGDTWSVLNYFDTNDFRKNKLSALFNEASNRGEVRGGRNTKEVQQEWLIKFFSEGSTELKKLIQQQRDAVLRSDDVEKNAMDLISDNYMTYPKGHKIDRYGGIDAVDLNNNTTYQIKTINDVQEMVDTETGEIIWRVFGDKSRIKDYKDKSQLNKLGYFIKDKGVLYVFDNKNYKVINKDEVHHFENPTTVKK